MTAWEISAQLKATSLVSPYKHTQNTIRSIHHILYIVYCIVYATNNSNNRG